MANPTPTTDLAVVDMPAPSSPVTAFAMSRPPTVVLEEARHAAVALKKVLDGKQHPVVFGGERYLEFEDWQTVGRFYGVTCKVVSTTFVEYGSVHGFSARAVALRADGVEISAADADCLNDEERWRVRPRYEWRDGPHGRRQKDKVGEEPVPLFQLKSMAQTRASAKALRNVLAWVVVLAGYRPTPAEEVDDVKDRDDDRDLPPPPEDPPPARASRRPAPPPATYASGFAHAAEGETVPARPVAVPSPTPGAIGTIAKVEDRDNGVYLVKLSTGFVAGTRDPQIVEALKKTPATVAIELVTRAPLDPSRAPLILEVRPAGRGGGS